MLCKIRFADNKAFTLIELLVVVAIIGILAAVGVVAYNGYTGAAKASSTKSNHKMIVKYITAETLKCAALGETMAMDNELNCADVSCFDNCNWSVGKKVETATLKALIKAGLKNPYFSASSYEEGVRKTGSLTRDTDVGSVLLNGAGKQVSVDTCFKLPCNVQENQLTNRVNTY